jgi:hypothetical protein
LLTVGLVDHKTSPQASVGVACLENHSKPHTHIPTKPSTFGSGSNHFASTAHSYSERPSSQNIRNQDRQSFTSSLMAACHAQTSMCRAAWNSTRERKPRTDTVRESEIEGKPQAHQQNQIHQYKCCIYVQSLGGSCSYLQRNYSTSNRSDNIKLLSEMIHLAKEASSCGMHVQSMAPLPLLCQLTLDHIDTVVELLSLRRRRIFRMLSSYVKLCNYKPTTKPQDLPIIRQKHRSPDQHATSLH